MLTFVGLGLWDEASVTVTGQEAIRSADRVFAEFYTSRLTGATIEDLEAAHDVEIELRDRSAVEADPTGILDASAAGSVVFLTAGDPMIATTHVDLRLRAHRRGLETRIVHGTTAATAAASLTGLQNYRFGKATTLPFPDSTGGAGIPASVLETIDANRERGLHTLVFLDVKAEREAFMTADTGAAQLAAERPELLGVVIARAGSPDPLVEADRVEALAERDYGPPLHLIVIPADLHHIEREALVAFAGAHEDALPPV